MSGILYRRVNCPALTGGARRIRFHSKGGYPSEIPKTILIDGQFPSPLPFRSTS